MARFLPGRQKTLRTLPKRPKCFSIMSFLLRSAGTFLHWMVVQSEGDMPLRLSELSLRTPCFTGVVVSSFGTGAFPECREGRWVSAIHYFHSFKILKIQHDEAFCLGCCTSSKTRIIFITTGRLEQNGAMHILCCPQKVNQFRNITNMCSFLPIIMRLKDFLSGVEDLNLASPL